MGCAVGRSSFELSKLFDEVIGIDYSRAFVSTCDCIRASSKQSLVAYSGKLEGDLHQQGLHVHLDDDVRVDRVAFEVGDACDLRADLGCFDLVLASNLICRLVEPGRFIARLKQLVKPHKYAILSTPFTWGEQYTPKQNWLGGYSDPSGKPVSGSDGLKAAMSDTFDLRHEFNIPMVIRETRRKFQYTVCYVTIWQKR